MTQEPQDPWPIVTPELHLSGREALITAWMFFPRDGQRPLTVAEMAERLGVTETRVRQCIRRAANTFRQYEAYHYGIMYGPKTEEQKKAEREAVDKYRRGHRGTSR